MLFVYRYLTIFLFPVLFILIYLRTLFGKEDKIRFKEKIFSSSFYINQNKDKKLIWFHAASIGEVSSIIELIKTINNTNINFIITSVTLTSGNLIKKEFNNFHNIVHRYFPLDCPHLVKQFLKLSRPNLAIFVDSEIWPNFLFAIKEAAIPLVLINGRITKKTFNKWKMFPKLAEKVFDNFDLCLASSKESANNLKQLNAKNIKLIGNLKFISRQDSKSINDVDKNILDNRKVWCATSTHEGEEIYCLNAHLQVKKVHKNLVTIIAPRHIDRVSAIKKLSDNLNLKTQILNDNKNIEMNMEIIIINSFGELSKYFKYCKSVFIGKSTLKQLETVGGQNPIEAAKLGCKIYHGPYVYNFAEVYKFLNSYSITDVVKNEEDLAEKLIQDFKENKKINSNNIEQIDLYGNEILNETVAELKKFI